MTSAVPGMVWGCEPSWAIIMASWWLWPHLGFWKAKAKQESHGFLVGFDYNLSGCEVSYIIVYTLKIFSSGKVISIWWKCTSHIVDVLCFPLSNLKATHLHSVWRSGPVQFFDLQMGKPQPQLVQDQPGYLWDWTRPPRTGLFQLMDWKKTGSDQFFYVNFVTLI